MTTFFVITTIVLTIGIFSVHNDLAKALGRIQKLELLYEETKRQIESIDASAENYLTKYNDRALPYDLQAIKETCREKNSFNNPEEWTTWDNYWNYRWSCYPESWGNTMRLDPPFQSLNIN